MTGDRLRKTRAPPREASPEREWSDIEDSHREFGLESGSRTSAASWPIAKSQIRTG